MQSSYHMFYQYYPYNTVWGPMHWGHATSRDLMHWTYQSAALAPDSAADAGGCFSGTALPLEDGRLMLLYTGVQPAGTGHRERQAQCAAFGDGIDFVKAEQNPVIDESLLPEGYSAFDFRDPKVFRGEDGMLRCVAGNRHEERQGSILLFESEDGLKWRFVSELLSSGGEFGRMSLPREVTIRNGRLCQQPVREIKNLWKDSVRLNDVPLCGEASFPGIAGRSLDMTVTLHVNGAAACRRFELRFAKDERCFTIIRCALSRGELVFDRTNCGSHRDIPHVRRIHVEPREGKLTLRLILDKDCVELFVGDGEHVLSALIDTPLSAEGMSFCSDGPLTMDIEKHEIG